jgi:hypothetical protein
MITYIIDPRNGRLCTIEQWRKEPDPTIAELVCISGSMTGHILMHKNLLRDENGIIKCTWDKACELVEHLEIASTLPTRHQCIDIYDARFCGLDEALELIGGDPLTDYWIWTGEEDPDPECKSIDAFIFYGGYGGVGTCGKDNVGAVRPIAKSVPLRWL